MDTIFSLMEGAGYLSSERKLLGIPFKSDFPEMVVESVSVLSLFSVSPLLCSYLYHFLLQRVFPDPEIEPRASALHGDSLLPEPMGSPVYTQQSFIFIYIGKNKQDVGDMEGAFSRLPASSKVLFERPHKGSVCIGEYLSHRT